MPIQNPFNTFISKEKKGKHRLKNSNEKQFSLNNSYMYVISPNECSLSFITTNKILTKH